MGFRVSVSHLKLFQFLYEHVDKDDRNYHELQLEESEFVISTTRNFLVLGYMPFEQKSQEKANCALARSLARGNSLFKEGVFVHLWRSLAVFGRDLSTENSRGRKTERKNIPRYPAFDRTHTHIERQSHDGLGAGYSLGLRTATCIYVCMCVHITFNYTISLGFVATSIKTSSLPPLTLLIPQALSPP